MWRPRGLVRAAAHHYLHGFSCIHFVHFHNRGKDRLLTLTTETKGDRTSTRQLCRVNNLASASEYHTSHPCVKVVRPWDEGHLAWWCCAQVCSTGGGDSGLLAQLWPHHHTIGGSKGEGGHCTPHYTSRTVIELQNYFSHSLIHISSLLLSVYSCVSALLLSVFDMQLFSNVTCY